MNEIKVSVIVPIYNAEKYLSRTIEYLKKQTLKEIEIILVDDGSTDSSPAICDEACKSDERIKCIHKRNAGVSAARNDGIQAAQGEYLMFCDADDIPSTHMAEKLLHKIESEHADIVLSGFIKQIDNAYINCDIPYSESLTERDNIIRKLIMPMIVWGYSPDRIALPAIYGSVWRGLYKKSLIVNKAIQFPSTICLGEDMVFNTLAFLFASRITFINDYLYTYIENLNSSTHTNGTKMWSKYLKTWICVHQIITENIFNANDILWHNYQLSRYAISAILEGICSQKCNKDKKQIMVRNILNDYYLAESVKSLPKNISRKSKLICFLIKKKRYKILLTYYQHIYNKSI